MPPKSKYPSSAAGVGVPTLMPRTKTQKVSLTDPDTKKTRLLSRSGPAARAIYIYISPPPSWVVADQSLSHLSHLST